MAISPGEGSHHTECHHPWINIVVTQCVNTLPICTFSACLKLTVLWVIVTQADGAAGCWLCLSYHGLICVPSNRCSYLSQHLNYHYDSCNINVSIKKNPPRLIKFWVLMTFVLMILWVLSMTFGLKILHVFSWEQLKLSHTQHDVSFWSWLFWDTFILYLIWSQFLL